MIVIAQMQNIVYGQYLPNILGPETMNLYDLGISQASTYNSDTDPSITNAFATAAIRSTIEAFSETQASTTSLCQIDFELPSQMTLPILFVFAAILGSVLEARSAKKQLVSSQLRPILTQKCKIFLHSRKLTSAAEVSISLLNEFLR